MATARGEIAVAHRQENGRMPSAAAPFPGSANGATHACIQITDIREGRFHDHLDFSVNSTEKPR
jgi:hypothetical protein